jgi:hypothetical protein
MSHFLARLVERTRGTAARLEPVIAPRFAPAPVPEITEETVATPWLRPAMAPAFEKNPPAREVVREELETSRPSTAREKTVEVVKETLLPPSESREPVSLLLVRRTEAETGDVVIPKSPPTSRGKPSPARLTTGRSAAAPSDSAPQKRRALPNEPSAEAPIVRVTIGRIEVRAVSAPVPAPQKPKPSAAPGLTLDAYLQARKEDAR